MSLKFTLKRKKKSRTLGDRGATSIEYGLIASLVALAAITSLGSVGNSISSRLNRISDSLASEADRPSVGGAAVAPTL